MHILRLRNNARIREVNPTQEILNEGLIAHALRDCLNEDDFEGIIEVLNIYFDALNA
jgi:hypothetical protein